MDLEEDCGFMGQPTAEGLTQEPMSQFLTAKSPHRTISGLKICFEGKLKEYF